LNNIAICSKKVFVLEDGNNGGCILIRPQKIYNLRHDK